MNAPRWSWAWVILLAVLPGCSRTPAPPAGTGAKEAVRKFYEALVRQEWPQAYVALQQDSKNRLTPQEFTRLAQTYHRNLGFSPEGLHVQSCDEKGPEAIAHVVLTGHSTSKQRRYKDAVVLRQSGAGWGVILPDSFGRIAR